MQENIYIKHYKTIKKFFSKRVHQDQVDDLTHSTYLVLLKKLSEGEDIEDLGRYLYGVARNLTKNFYTKMTLNNYLFTTSIDPDTLAQTEKFNLPLHLMKPYDKAVLEEFMDTGMKRKGFDEAATRLKGLL